MNVGGYNALYSNGVAMRSVLHKREDQGMNSCVGIGSGKFRRNLCSFLRKKTRNV